MNKRSFFKSYGGTLLMLVISLGVGIIAYQEYNSIALEEEDRRVDKMILGWEDVSNYKRVKLTRPGKEIIEVVHIDNTWQVVQPLKDEGNEATLESWLTDIGTGEGSEIQGKTDSSGNTIWSEYGLTGELVQIDFENTTGGKAVLEFAKNSAFDGSLFIRYNDKLWVGDKSWATIIDRDLKYLRNKKVYRKKNDPIDVVIEIKNPRSKVQFAKKDNIWQFAKESSFPLREQRIRNWMAQVKSLKSSAFIDSSPSKKQLAKYGFHAPVGKFLFEFDDNLKESWIIGEVNANNRLKYYVKTSSSPVIFEVDGLFIKKLLAHKDQFRDGTEPFKFELEDISKVVIEEDKEKILIKKDASGKWDVSDNAFKEKFDVKKFELYMESLKKLDAQIFLSKSQSQGLNSPKLRLKLLDSSDQSRFELTFGDSFKSERSEDKSSLFVYTQVSGYSGVLGVASDQKKNLSLNNVFADPPEPKKNKKDLREQPPTKGHSH